MFKQHRRRKGALSSFKVRLAAAALAVVCGVSAIAPVPQSHAALATLDLSNLAEARRQLAEARKLYTEAQKQAAALDGMRAQIGSAMSYVGRMANDPKRLRNELMSCIPASPIGGVGGGASLPSLCDAVSLVEQQLDIPASGGADTQAVLLRRADLRERDAVQSVAVAMHAKDDLKRTQTEYEALVADASSGGQDLATTMAVQNRILLKILDEQIKQRNLLAQLVAQQGSQGLSAAPQGPSLRPSGPVTGLGSRGN